MFPKQNPISSEPTVRFSSAGSPPGPELNRRTRRKRRVGRFYLCVQTEEVLVGSQRSRRTRPLKGEQGLQTTAAHTLPSPERNRSWGKLQVLPKPRGGGTPPFVSITPTTSHRRVCVSYINLGTVVKGLNMSNNTQLHPDANLS